MTVDGREWLLGVSARGGRLQGRADLHRDGPGPATPLSRRSDRSAGDLSVPRSRRTDSPATPRRSGTRRWAGAAARPRVRGTPGRCGAKERLRSPGSPPPPTGIATQNPFRRRPAGRRPSDRWYRSARGNCRSRSAPRPSRPPRCGGTPGAPSPARNPCATRPSARRAPALRAARDRTAGPDETAHRRGGTTRERRPVPAPPAAAYRGVAASAPGRR